MSVCLYACMCVCVYCVEGGWVSKWGVWGDGDCGGGGGGVCVCVCVCV